MWGAFLGGDGSFDNGDGAIVTGYFVSLEEGGRRAYEAQVVGFKKRELVVEQVEIAGAG